MNQFPDLINSVISGGFGYVALRDGGMPTEPSPAAWGWENATGRGSKIGWLIGNQLCLDPGSTYLAIVQFFVRQGLTFPLSESQLFRRLKSEGALVGCDEGRTICRRQIEGKDHRVSVVPLHLLSAEVPKVSKPSEGDDCRQQA